ncbi:Mercuric transport protein, MerC [hydrothermal vent metagenome]|uniref:Mercuric transport protein, MerC n=1 Tax=hydrothermal vent metagenome TaxID=652676 RepID=A0A3B0WS81_9ZZZZ
MTPLALFTRIGDKISALGAVVSAMGCAMCFPAIASLGGALGMSFLGQWEWTLIATILPAFAWIALVLNALGYFSHRQVFRSLLGMTGPVLLLISLYPLFQYAWSTYVTYSALGLMVVVSIGDMVYPANRRCDDSCDLAKSDNA